MSITKTKLASVVIILAIVAAALVMVYDLNGHSLNLNDRETRIIVTGSMSGDSHPSYWYECDECHFQTLNGDKSKGYSEPTVCEHCGKATTFTKHAIEIGSIGVNTLVMIEKLDKSEMGTIHVGDVISFMNTSTNLLTIHRVTAIDYDTSGNLIGFETRGDNASGGESPVLDDVQGKVVGTSPILGQLVHFAQTKTVLLVMIIVILFVIVSVIRDIINIRRSNRSE